jgi:hypothetical protein
LPKEEFLLLNLAKLVWLSLVAYLREKINDGVFREIRRLGSGLGWVWRHSRRADLW